jgi:hypothetical protein
MKVKTQKLKTYQCIEHNEMFYIEAKDRQEAQEIASMYGGSVIKEIFKNN